MKAKGKKTKVENDVREYFPYIAHRIDYDFIEHGKFRFARNGRSAYDFYVGGSLDSCIFEDEQNDIKIFPGRESALFSEQRVRGIEGVRELSRNPKNVFVYVPRHRSLVDFIALHPITYFLVRQNTMILSGDNLFLPHMDFDEILRKFGGITYMRGKKDKEGNIVPMTLKPKGLERRKITAEEFNLAYSAYIREAMIHGTHSSFPETTQDLEERIRYDMIAFLEYYERFNQFGAPEIASGRTKDGSTNKISTLPILPIYKGLKDSDVNVFVVPVNISFSKYIDSFFIKESRGLFKAFKNLKYLYELFYVFSTYPHYSEKHPEAKLSATYSFGEPLNLKKFNPKQVISKNETPDSLSYAVRENIENQETIYPTVLLFNAMQDNDSISVEDLDTKVKRSIDQYEQKGIDVSQVTDNYGNPFSGSDIYDLTASHLNSNPTLFFRPSVSNTLIVKKNGRVKSKDIEIQKWYGNQIKHLD